MEKSTLKNGTEVIETKSYKNCLRNTKVIVRHINKQTGIVTDPKSPLFGGMAENAEKTFCVPKLSSGLYVNVLTDEEKGYLEEVMGLEQNALSIYKKTDNFWSDANDTGISVVRLRKQDNYLDLSNPEDYIKYKILLANKDMIAPSIKALEDKPKATYQFVLIEEGQETSLEKERMTLTMKCYKEFGKIENDYYTLKSILESYDGKPIAKNTRIEYLQTKINELIQNDSKIFYKFVSDEYLPYKVLIGKALEKGVIAKRANYYYLKSDNSPLCEDNEEPTINIAARFLSSPKRQDLKFSIEEKLNE